MNIKKIFVGIVLSIVAVNTFAFASDSSINKNEIVYVNLDNYGVVKEINVHTEYYIQNIQEITDHAQYITLQNLTNKETADTTEGVMKWNVSGLDKFSYTGKIDNTKAVNIPWNIGISYKLNGIDTSVENLIGKNGVVRVHINVTPNKEADTYYQNNYMLEITGDFDMNNYVSVYSEEATEVITGKTKTLMFIVLPGKEENFNIEIGSTDFEMNGLSFAMIPLQGDIYEVISEIVKNKMDMEKASDNLNVSTDIILKNLEEMKKGINEIIDGTKSVKGGSENIYGQSSERNENLENLRIKLNDLNSLTTNTVNDLKLLEKRVIDVNTMLTEINEVLKPLSIELKTMESDLDDLEDMLVKLPGDLTDLKKLLHDSQSLLGHTQTALSAQIAGSNYDTTTLMNSLNDIGTYTSQIATIASTAASTATPEDAVAFGNIASKAGNIGTKMSTVNTELTNIQGIMDDGTIASRAMISDMSKLKTDLSKLETDLDDVIDYSYNVSDAVDNIESITNSMSKALDILIKNIDKYLENKDDVTNAIVNIENILTQLQSIQVISDTMIKELQTALKAVDNEIYTGAKEASDGVLQTLNKTLNILSQTQSIRESKDTIRNITKSRVDEITNETTIFNIDPTVKVVSFTSEENDSPKTVQILLQSDSIKEKVIEDISDIEPKKEKISLWDRIVNIFVIIYNTIVGIFVKK